MEVIRNRFQKLFPGRNINIGLDTAVIIGDPSTIAAATMLVPVSLILAAILPWNKTIPFADLSSLAFAMSYNPYVNGNVVKLLIVVCFNSLCHASDINCCCTIDNRISKGSGFIRSA